MVGIYCITNTENNLRYIGQSKHIEKRFHEHLRDDAKLNTKLGKDIKEFGIRCFSLTILQECEIDELDRLEKEWIKKLGTYPDEYNMTPGGRDGVVDYDKIRALTKEQVKESWESGLCIKEIIKKYGKSSHSAIMMQLTEMGYTEEEIRDRGEKRKKEKQKAKKVIQLSLDGEKIKIYNSLNEAGRELNIQSQNIGKVCKGLRKQCGGYIWKYLEDVEVDGDENE